MHCTTCSDTGFFESNGYTHKCSCQIEVGDRVKLIRMGNDPNPIPEGTLGTVTRVNPIRAFHETQISVDWDNGRNLMVLLPHDAIVKVNE